MNKIDYSKIHEEMTPGPYHQQRIDGANHYVWGISWDYNPYTSGTPEYNAWFAGWVEAENAYDCAHEELLGDEYTQYVQLDDVFE